MALSFLDERIVSTTEDQTMTDAVYSRDQVERWQEKLEKIAVLPRTTFTKKQVVEELIDVIEKALTMRSYDEVAKELAADGLEISAGSLKQYVSKFRRSQKAKPVGAGRKRSAQAKKENSAKRSNEKAEADKSARIKSQKKAAANRTPDGFLEMAEDL